MPSSTDSRCASSCVSEEADQGLDWAVWAARVKELTDVVITALSNVRWADQVSRPSKAEMLWKRSQFNLF